MNAHYSRRHFLKQSAAAAGALALLPGDLLHAQAAPKRTAADLVTLGGTGIQVSRLGMGTGSGNGHVQTALGRDGFTKLVHHAYDQGIRLFDTAETYSTFTWIADAIKGLPREKLVLQSKIQTQPADVLAAIDRHRKTFNTDYVDSVLVHCMYKAGWTDDWKRTLDGFNQAKDKQWIRAKGVSCHSLPALRASIASDWTEVHLVRVNPQGRRVDGLEEMMWQTPDPGHDIAPVLAELKHIRAKGRGVIGMKIIGDGAFINPDDREKSIRYAMSRPELDAVIIGFKSPDEIDEAIRRMNAALAEPA
jgi:aryl-alcohol dehydrogenase-like predicted oxidoreductase